jgi:DNA polymerase elongation subunit (family B)
MNTKIALDKILFLDIETIPQTYQYIDLDEKTKELFNAKNRFAQNEEKSFEMLYNEKGSILSEFGKIICISFGMVHKTTLGRTMRLKSFAHDDEETLLKQFKKLLEDHYNTNEHLLCGHNAKEFDFPYICRRMLINGISLDRKSVV